MFKKTALFSRDGFPKYYDFSQFLRELVSTGDEFDLTNLSYKKNVVKKCPGICLKNIDMGVFRYLVVDCPVVMFEPRMVVL